METTTEPEIEEDIQQQASFSANPITYHLVIYLTCILIGFIVLSLVIRILLNKEGFEERSIREAKIKYNNDQYYRHPKY